MIDVEVCYVSPTGATRVAVALADGATLRDAVASSGIVATLALAGADLAYAVFGRRATEATSLFDGDRVELLRPLRVDPKDARRRRAAVKGRHRQRPDPQRPARDGTERGPG